MLCCRPSHQAVSAMSCNHCNCTFNCFAAVAHQAVLMITALCKLTRVSALLPFLCRVINDYSLSVSLKGPLPGRLLPS